VPAVVQVDPQELKDRTVAGGQHPVRLVHHDDPEVPRQLGQLVTPGVLVRPAPDRVELLDARHDNARLLGHPPLRPP
jgi:hypothetical protein